MISYKKGKKSHRAAKFGGQDNKLKTFGGNFPNASSGIFYCNRSRYKFNHFILQLSKVPNSSNNRLLYLTFFIFLLILYKLFLNTFDPKNNVFVTHEYINYLRIFLNICYYLKLTRIFTVILVRNQNEELMNSLDREEFGPSDNNTDYNMYR